MGGGPANPSFREVLEVDVASKTILVGAGYTFKECLPLLDRAGLILHGTPEVDTITIGGAIAVGAHGGGRFQKPCSDYIKEMWILDGQGELVRVDPADPAFPAAAVSLGLLGPIVRVQLQCFEPRQNRRAGPSIDWRSFCACAFCSVPRLHTLRKLGIERV